MRLGCKVSYKVKVIILKQSFKKRYVANIAVEKLMPCCLTGLKVFKVGGITGISYRVQVNNAPVWLHCQCVADEVCSNKSGTAGHQDISSAHDRILFGK